MDQENDEEYDHPARPKPQTQRRRKRSQRTMQKHVWFDASHDVEYEVPHINDIDNANEIWYSQNEYRKIRSENKETAKLLRQGQVERLDICFRGLEYKCKLVAKQRNKVIAKAERIVFYWQIRGASADLALDYSTHCRASQQAAHRLGLADAAMARSIAHRERTSTLHGARGNTDFCVDESPKMPRRTWARAC